MNIPRLNKSFKRIIKKNKTACKLANYMKESQASISKTKDSIEAFSLSMKKNYTPIPTNWGTITQYKGAKILQDYMSANTFKRYVKLGFFRSDNNQVYLEEVKKFKDVADFIQELYKNDVLQESKEFGQKRIVLYPSSVNKLGLSKQSQKIKAGLFAIKESWFQDWIQSMDFS